MPNKKSVTNSLDMSAAYIAIECRFISLDICIISTTTKKKKKKKKSNHTDLLPKCCLVNGHVVSVKYICISET